MTTSSSSDIRVLVSDPATQETLLFERPAKVIALRDPANLNSIFTNLENSLDSGLWAAGFLSYELGYCLENRFDPPGVRKDGPPYLWFGLFDEPLRLSREEAGRWLDNHQSAFCLTQPLKLGLSSDKYCARFNEVKRHIAAGDIYQLNLTFKAGFEIAGDPLALYRALWHAQPVDHGAFIQADGFSVLSASPELFLTIQNRQIETRPMKGTEPRGQNDEADIASRERLKIDPKQRAENLMIVDLMRNDIARIAKIGSVKVPHLFTVETYPTLHQLTSTVVGQLEHNVSIETLIRALFPAGSITGAPKIKAMEIIRRLEDGPRGVYCGSIGFVKPDRSLSMNVAIRTAFIDQSGKAEIGIGSGIVADSVASNEYAEAQLKMRFLEKTLMDFDLFETILYEKDKGFWLIEEHMARMAKSAAALDFVFNHKEALRLLEEQVNANGGQRLRVRLVLTKQGELSVTCVAMPKPANEANPSIKPIRFIVSPTRLNSADGLLRHKITRRTLYDGEFKHYSGELGVDEVIYLNEKGELTEGSRTNIFLKIGDETLTPPLTCGLLPGTLRSHLIEKGEVKEAVLMADQLDEAQTIWLGNSVRGMQLAVKR